MDQTFNAEGIRWAKAPGGADIAHFQSSCDLAEVEQPFDIAWLRKAVEWVQYQDTLPNSEREWWQSDWRLPGAVVGRSCDTVYCVAGYLGEMNPDIEFVSPFSYHTTDNKTAARVAREMLGICVCESDYLFSGANTAEDVTMAARTIAYSHGEDLGL